jgi:hypothetical protein
MFLYQTGKAGYCSYVEGLYILGIEAGVWPEMLKCIGFGQFEEQLGVEHLSRIGLVVDIRHSVPMVFH